MNQVFFKALYDYGVAQGGLSPYQEVVPDFFLEMHGKVHLRPNEQGTVLSKPRNSAHGSKIDPWQGADTARYVLMSTPRPSKKQDKEPNVPRDFFWDLNIQWMRDIQRPDLEAAAIKARKALEDLKLDPEVDMKLGQLILSHKVLNKHLIVLTYKGEPVISMPAFRALWEERWEADLQDPRPATSVDAITGQPCIPVTKHSDVQNVNVNGSKRGIPGSQGNCKAASFKYAPYGMTLDGRPTDCDVNFPVSPQTDKTYTQALEQVSAHFTASLTKDSTGVLFVSIWPKNASEHPLVEAALTILRGSSLDPLPKDSRPKTTNKDWRPWHKPRIAYDNMDIASAWEVVQRETDDEPLNVCLARGSLKRMGLINFQEITAKQLRVNLLRFLREFSVLGSPGCIDFKRLMTVCRAGEKQGLFFGMRQAQLVWPILTGEPYPLMAKTLPERLLPLVTRAEMRNYSYLRKEPNSMSKFNYGLMLYIEAWAEAYTSRQEKRDPVSNNKYDDNDFSDLDALSDDDVAVWSKSKGRYTPNWERIEEQRERYDPGGDSEAYGGWYAMYRYHKYFTYRDSKGFRSRSRIEKGNIEGALRNPHKTYADSKEEVKDPKGDIEVYFIKILRGLRARNIPGQLIKWKARKGYDRHLQFCEWLCAYERRYYKAVRNLEKTGSKEK